MNDYSIVLVEPVSPGNIGSVCRAMANFGASNLRLVNPGCNHLDKDAVKMAVFAEPLLEGAVVYSSLAEAVADCHYSIAATRREGTCRNKLQPLATTAELFTGKSARIALVFGRERSGLTTEEVVMCSHAAVIETTAEGSLNLAQAVIVFLYEFTRHNCENNFSINREIPEQGVLEDLFVSMQAVLNQTGYLNSQKPEALMNKLRRIYQRAELGADELSLLRGIWNRLEESINDWPGRRRG